MPKRPQQKPPAKGKSPQQHGAKDGPNDGPMTGVTGGPALMARIADALERLAPAASSEPDFAAAEAFTWYPAGRRVVPVPQVSRVAMSLLKGIDRVRDLLVDNTERFARALPANNALLWGARGMGKSSLVKAVHAAVNASHGKGALKLVEIATSRSRRCSKAASKAAPTTSCSMPPRTGVT